MSDDVFRWVIAVGVLLACIATIVQAVILTALYRAGMEARKKAEKAGKEVESKVMPIVQKVESLVTASNKILDDNRARVADITAQTLVIIETGRKHVDRIGELIDDVKQLVDIAKLHAERVGELIDETSGRARARIVQIDETVSHTVDQVEHAGEAVKSAVLRPVKEVNGIVAGVKAAFSTMAQGSNRNSPEHATQDEEMFI